MKMKKIFSRKNLLLIGQMIFWLYVLVFFFGFNFFVNLFSYDKIKTLDTPILNTFPIPTVSPADKASQATINNTTLFNNNNENRWPSFESRFFSAKAIEFPKIESAHDNLDVEWWYITTNLNDVQKNNIKFHLALSLFRNSSGSFIKISNFENEKTYVKKLPFLANDLFDKNKLDINFEGGHFFKKSPSEYEISFKQNELEFNLTFESLKDPLVLENDNDRFNYQQTKVKTSGMLVIQNIKYQVEGHSWFEHQGMPGKSVGFYYGWRWVALQLDNDVELLWIKAYPRKETGAKNADVIIVYDNKNKKLLNNQSFSIENLSYWKKELYGELYPLSTRLKIPSLSVDLNIKITPIDFGLKQMNGIFEGGGTIEGYYQNKKVNGLAHQEINPTN